MRGSNVVEIRPNVPLVIEVFGSLNWTVFRMLKNSARNSILSFSPHSGVTFPISRSRFVRLGPRKAFLGKEPYVRSPGLVTQGRHVDPPSPVVVKFVGLK